MSSHEDLMREKAAQGISGAIGGMGMSQCATVGTKCPPPELRERVRRSRERSGVEIDRFSKLQELEYLLDKNPEIARILELMEATGQR